MRRWSTAVSPRSSTDCMHNRKIVLGFAKHIRENMGTFAQLFPAFSQNSATFSGFFPPFSPLSVSVRGTVAGLTRRAPFFSITTHALRCCRRFLPTGCQFVRTSPLAAKRKPRFSLSSSRHKGRKRQLRNTFSPNTSSATHIFFHSYRSPTKK